MHASEWINQYERKQTFKGIGQTPDSMNSIWMNQSRWKQQLKFHPQRNLNSREGRLLLDRFPIIMPSNVCKEYGQGVNALRCEKVSMDNVPTGQFAVVMPINRSTPAESKYGGKTDVKMFKQPFSRLVCLACYPVSGFMDDNWRVISSLSAWPSHLVTASSPLLTFPHCLNTNTFCHSVFIPCKFKEALHCIQSKYVKFHPLVAKKTFSESAFFCVYVIGDIKVHMVWHMVGAFIMHSLCNAVTAPWTLAIGLQGLRHMLGLLVVSPGAKEHAGLCNCCWSHGHCPFCLFTLCKCTCFYQYSLF